MQDVTDEVLQELVQHPSPPDAYERIGWYIQRMFENYTYVVPTIKRTYPGRDIGPSPHKHYWGTAEWNQRRQRQLTPWSTYLTYALVYWSADMYGYGLTVFFHTDAGPNSWGVERTARAVKPTYTQDTVLAAMLEHIQITAAGQVEKDEHAYVRVSIHEVFDENPKYTSSDIFSERSLCFCAFNKEGLTYINQTDPKVFGEQTQWKRGQDD